MTKFVFVTGATDVVVKATELFPHRSVEAAVSAEAGVDKAPATWDEYFVIAEKLKAKLSLSASSGGTVELGPRKLQGSHHFGNTGGSQNLQSGWQFMNQLVGQARVIKIGSSYLYGGGTDQEELHDIVDGLNSADPNDWDIDRL